MQLLDKENSDVANSVKEMRLSGEFPFSIEKSGKKLLFLINTCCCLKKLM